MLLAPFRIYPDFTIKPDNDLVVGDPTTETTNGKQVVTYKINPKAVWSDGTADHLEGLRVHLAVQKSADPAKGGCASLIATTGYDQIASVEGSDNDKTVTVTYSKPFSDWKSLFTLYPQHIMDKTDPKANCDAITKGWPTAQGIPVASGPYLLDKAGIDPNKKIMTLSRNPKWYGSEASKLDRIIVQSIGNDPAVSVSALRNNEVQMIYPQPQLDLVKQIKGLEPTITSSTNFGLLVRAPRLQHARTSCSASRPSAGDRVRAEPARHRRQDRRPVRRPRAGAEQPLLRQQPARTTRTTAAACTTSRTSPRRSRCWRATASPRAPTASTRRAASGCPSS